MREANFQLMRLPTRVIIIDATIAVQNESIVNPPTMLVAIRRRIALITKVKSPRVRRVIGNVKRVKIFLYLVLLPFPQEYQEAFYQRCIEFVFHQERYRTGRMHRQKRLGYLHIILTFF